MNTREALNHYIGRMERVLRLFAVSRGAAVASGAALIATVLLAWFIAHSTLSMGGLLVARLALFVSIGAALAFGVVIPLLRINPRAAASRAEKVFPEFQQRLLTLAERGRSNEPNPFLDLLAMEAGEVAERAHPSQVASRTGILGFLASAAGALAVLLWLILAGPGYLGNGASLLWAGVSKAGSESLYSLAVKPGNAAVRRKSDQWITAELGGFDTPDVRLFARFRGGSKWEEAPMLPRSGRPGYEFLFAAVPDDVEYYVSARGLRSDTYKLSVLDLPGIKKMKVTYRYPAWTGLAPTTEEPGGDLRAVAGTVAELEVEFDKPVATAAIAVDENPPVKMNANGAIARAQVPIEKDGMYHFVALEGNMTARLSEDYFIEAKQDSAPVVSIVRPGRDAKASPIEEVPVTVEAEDDFGLQEVALHYSVNGGPERTVQIAKGGVKKANGKTLLTLEDFKMSPGDVVSMYATARDARNTSRTDMFFIEAQAFEREYSQSQQDGGGMQGGGGGDDEQQVAQRQKEIIAATWNLIKDQKSSKKPADDAKFLSEVQRTLKGQAQSMVNRAKSRELAETNQSFQQFVKELESATREMGAAEDKLKAQALNDAIGPEQRALQHLLRAEMTIKEIQVAFGSRSQGQGGGGAARDLENLFDLELDTEKNQYETGQNMQSASDRQKEVDEALQRLEQLARRQQELAQQQNQQKQSIEQRWQQEQLRREAEELRRRMEELTRQSASSSQSQSSQSSQSQGQSGQQSRSSQNGQAGSQSQSDARLRQAFDRLTRATDDMRQAASNPEQREAGARRAAERLQEAQNLLRGMRKDQSSAQLSDLGNRSEQLAGRQREFQDKLRQATASQAGGGQRDRGRDAQLANEKEQMARELDRLEQDVQRAARDLQGSQPKAAGKLREGLGEIQQNEVKLRMKYAANWIRNGRGSFMQAGEMATTSSLEKLRDQVRAAQTELERAGGQDDKGVKSGDKTEQALERVEQAREALERAARQGRQNGQPGQRGQQQAQEGQQQGQQQGGQQQGQQAGGQQQGGQQQGGQQQGGQQQGGQQQGGRQQGGQQQGQPGGFQQGGPGGWNYGSRDSAIRQAIRDLNQLRGQFQPGTETWRDVNDAIRQLDRAQQQFALSSPEMEARIQREVLPSLEQIELRLRRKLDEANAGARHPAPDRIPPGYADRVADYFRRLSKAK